MPTSEWCVILGVEKTSNNGWWDLAEFFVGSEEDAQKIYREMVDMDEYPVIILAKVQERASK